VSLRQSEAIWRILRLVTRSPLWNQYDGTGFRELPWKRILNDTRFSTSEQLLIRLAYKVARETGLVRLEDFSELSEAPSIPLVDVVTMLGHLDDQSSRDVLAGLAMMRGV